MSKMTKKWISLLWALGSAAGFNALALAVMNPLMGKYTLQAILITFSAYLPISILGTILFGGPVLAILAIRHHRRTSAIVSLGFGCGELAAAVICYTTAFDWHWFALIGTSSIIGTLAALPFIRAGIPDSLG